jgi:hypothetical protein
MSDVFDVPGVDALFDAELSEFIAQRDALVKQRKAEGDKDGAALVKALRKPSTVAWGVNRIARTHPDDVDALLEAGAAVRAAQVRAVQGVDDGSLRATSRAWRERVNALGAKVAALIGEQYRDDAAASFEAASTDDTLASIVKHGRLTNAIEPAGFGLAGMPDPPQRRKEAAAEPTQEAAPEAGVDDAVDDGALDAAREELAQREKRLEQALHRLRRAEQRLDQAREAVDEARLAHADASDARDKAARVVESFTSS